MRRVLPRFMFPALLLAAALLPPVAVADMYTWRDPETGRTRMSNIPPPWVRDGSSGPRVEVIRGNRVIDIPTALSKPQPPAELSPSQRAAARLPAQDKPAVAPEPPKSSKPSDEDDE